MITNNLLVISNSRDVGTQKCLTPRSACVIQVITILCFTYCWLGPTGYRARFAWPRSSEPDDDDDDWWQLCGRTILWFSRRKIQYSSIGTGYVPTLIEVWVRYGCIAVSTCNFLNAQKLIRYLSTHSNFFPRPWKSWWSIQNYLNPSRFCCSI